MVDEQATDTAARAVYAVVRDLRNPFGKTWDELTGDERQEAHKLARAALEVGYDRAGQTIREQKLLFAAENVLSRWAIIRVSGGRLGACGLPEALKELDLACDAYEELEDHHE